MKTYTIIKTNRDETTREIKGTLEELTQYFSNSVRSPKSIKTLLNQLHSTYTEREAALYRRTSFHLKQEEPQQA